MPITKIEKPRQYGRFQRDSLADDLAAQEQYLQQRAEEAGFKDVDEFVDKDYAGFVKAAAEWRADNPAEALFSRGQPIQGNKFKIERSTLGETLKNDFIDSMSRVADVQKQVAKQGGFLSDSLDVSKSMLRSENRAGVQMEDFRRKTIEPLLQDIADSGVELGEIADYMYAAHAKEANAYIASINPLFPDGGSGMTNADADTILNALRSKPEFAQVKGFADRFQAITKDTQQVLINGGIISQNMADTWNNNYNYYVPLKGMEAADPDTTDAKATGNQSFDLKRDFSMRRKGRASRANQIIENIINDHQRAIQTAAINGVRQTFTAWIQHPQNRDTTLWQVNKQTAQPRWNSAYGVVDTYYKTNEKGSQTVPVRVNGGLYHVFIKDAGMHDDMSMTGMIGNKLTRAVSFIGKPVRMLAKLYTAWNPEFIYSNVMRDGQTAAISLAAEHGVKIAGDTLTKLGNSWMAVWKSERNLQNSQTVAITVNGQQLTFGQLFDMYKADGGKIGSLDVKSLDERKAELESTVANARANIGDPTTYHRLALKQFQKMEDLIMDVNGAFEQMYRLSAYAAVLQNGGSRTAAADVAMNVTVNFTRRGKFTPYLAPLYMFLNASIQGAVKTAQILTTKKGAYIASGLIGTGFLIAMSNMGAAGEDGEEYWYKKANRQSKIKYMLFYKSNGDAVKIPMAYGLGFFVNLGYVMHDMSTGKMSASEAMGFMLDSFLNHFSPLGGVDNLSTTVVPTLFKPVVVNSSNKTESGTPLMPEQGFGAPKPESELYWASTRGTVYQKFAEWLNEVSGGTKATSGAIDISPERMKYMVNFVGGGLLGTMAKTAEMLNLTFNVGFDAAVKSNTVPFLSRMYQVNNGKLDQIEYYANRDKATQALAEYKLISQNPELLKRSDVAERNASDSVARMGAAVQYFTKALSQLRDAQIAELSKEGIGTKEKYEIGQRYDKLKNDLYVRFNRDFYGSEKVLKAAQDSKK